MTRAWTALALLILGWPGTGPALAASDGNKPAALSDCDALRRDAPETLDPYICYWLVGRQTRQPDRAAARLERILVEEPDNARAELYLGLVEADMGREGAERRFRAAAEGLLEIGDHRGEVYARQSLIIYLVNRRRFDGLETEFEKADMAAGRSGDATLVAGVNLERGRLSLQMNDYSSAWTWYRKAESELFPDGPARLRARVLGGLGDVAWATGRYRESIESYSRQAALLRETGLRDNLAGTLYNIALMGGKMLATGEMTLAEVRALQKEALDEARAASNRYVEAEVLLQMAQDPDLEPAGQVLLAREALALARQVRNRDMELFALRFIALTLVSSDLAPPEEGFLLVEEALRLAALSGDLAQIARGRIIRAAMRWHAGPRGQALTDSLEALDAIERIRDLQTDDLIRARSFSEFAYFYYRLAGHILRPPDGSPSPEDLEQAFGVIERLRARVLMQSLDAAGVVRSGHGAADERREAILAAIARTHRRLASPGADVASLLKESDRLEIEEAAVRDEIARADPRFAQLVRPSIPSLGEVRSALAPDQAMMAFHLSSSGGRNPTDPDNGGSWVFVITHDAVRVMPLPDEHVIEAAASILLGTIERRDDLARTAARQLGRQLLDRSLAELPAGTRRLIVVPDRCLHRIPFGALIGEDDRYLAARYEISVTPSASLWLRWKRSPGSIVGLPALAVADPDLPLMTVRARSAGARAGVAKLELDPLPHARREARTVAWLMGRGSVLLAGSEASERALKRAETSRFGIIHIAAHALVDEEHPDRAAIVLAPGADEEDGLLQTRELASLRLDDRVVVLSACGTATGAVLTGEGVMGLARGFFQAGARAVVGSLWKLRDDEASILMPAFYSGLAEGQSIGAALSGAQRDLLRSGAPPAAWAGLVVLGDGDRPVRAAHPAGTRAGLPLSGAILLGFLIPAAIITFHALRSASGQA